MFVALLVFVFVALLVFVFVVPGTPENIDPVFAVPETSVMLETGKCNVIFCNFNC